MFTGKQVISNTMVSYHFKSSVLEPLIVTIKLKFHVELQVREKSVSQTGTDKN
jgi:hypothetical protein